MRPIGDEPTWLCDVGRQVWQFHLPRLRAMGYVTEMDTMALARLCDHTARWLDLREKVNKVGASYTTKSKHGKMTRLNPAFTAMLKTEERMAQLEDRLGLVPGSRQQILARRSDPVPFRHTITPGEGGKDAAHSTNLAPKDNPPASPIGLLAARPPRDALN